MAWSEIITLGVSILPFIVGPIMYLWRSIMLRIDKLEQEIDSKISKEDLHDKLDPVSDDIREVKARIDKILEHLLKAK